MVDPQPFGDGARRALRIARNHGDLDAHIVQRLDCARRRFLDRVFDRDQRRHAAVERDVERCLAKGRKAGGFPGKLPGVDLFAQHKPLGPDQNGAPVDLGLQPETGQRLEPVRLGKRQSTVLCRPQDRLPDGMLGLGFDARGKAQRLVRIVTDQVGKLRLALGQRPGLVERDDLDAFHDLKCVALAKQHAKLRAPTRADHDRGRRRQTHRTGTGDDEHRDTGDQSETQRRIGTEGEPDGHGHGGDGHDPRHEPAGDLIDKRLDRQFRPLRLFDHADDLGERGVGPDARGGDPQRPVGVHGAARHTVARPLFDRNRLAGDHAFIDVAFARQDFAIGRDRLAGTGDDDVAGSHLGGRDFPCLAVPLDPCGPGGEVHERADRLARPTLGTCLHPASEEDQSDDDRGAFEIHVRRACRENTGGKGRQGGIGKRRRRADRNQRVHVGRQAPKLRHARREEPASGDDEDQRG
ncbi:hypothetical protein RB2654_14845 [Rhodobacterales bacterium HTCC2654]|uniref:Uncharacterized protein n=1 Tax=Maritimibacter alkaliphilus HTCC2654 TaxID=314271 RepID=A3VH18_9RHOB|nr:hypothetical protein RB2654_14845 [Rhodobacterales bacterium HTCC2654] [Maritimibacter alkaliphilus HTCC2654]